MNFLFFLLQCHSLLPQLSVAISKGCIRGWPFLLPSSLSLVKSISVNEGGWEGVGEGNIGLASAALSHTDERIV
jgi:hypothetical protein